ncbi:ABC transporter ATP-binding protein/permease [Paenibacillus sp. ACRRX]|uniref:ABC transporter ATP-binding protein n=1 Tax=Paenibacillus sp. ACRRX TaxID=2918206 RepID=UPI001EF594E8|nr:ABC transporter ATP-binding protein [Paenibacillus sp. ACRRX]MCG7407030.1 ABC transporter ATP-binding protein/permease [Paenibacillus sp. ACRRX]
MQQALTFLFPLLWKVSRLSLCALLLITLLQAFVPIAQLSLTNELVNVAASLFKVNSNDLMSQAKTLVTIQLLLLLGGAFMQNARKYVEQYFNHRTALYFDEMLSTKVNRLSLSYFDSHTNFDQLQRTAFSLNLQGINLVFTILNIIQSIVTVSGYFLILFQFHWLLSAGMILLVFPMLVSYIYESKIRFELILKQTPDDRMTSYLSHVLKSREAAKELRVYEAAPYLIEKWKQLAWSIAKRKLSLERKVMGITYGVHTLSLVVLSGMVLFLLHSGAQGALEIGSYVALTQALFSTQTSVQGIAQSYSRIHQDIKHANEVIQFLQLPEENGPTQTENFPSPMTTGIVVNNLSFKYPSSIHPILNEISFTIQAGEKIAIVGANGAGKSTLAKCLLGLYKPDSGSIYVDGISLEHVKESTMRAHMSAVFQDFLQFPFSVKENIGMGQIEEMDNMERMLHSSDLADSSSFIKKLPQGWDTILGSKFTGGQELSYGQWQKIAVNRSIFRSFELIVLDEPTASLDPMTESSIFRNLMELTVGKTAIFISHRLGSCRYADRILVLKEGSLIEQGNHEELMEKDGEYAEMFRNQASWYTKEWEEEPLITGGVK